MNVDLSSAAFGTNLHESLLAKRLNYHRYLFLSSRTSQPNSADTRRRPFYVTSLIILHTAYAWPSSTFIRIPPQRPALETPAASRPRTPHQIPADAPTPRPPYLSRQILVRFIHHETKHDCQKQPVTAGPNPEVDAASQTRYIRPRSRFFAWFPCDRRAGSSVGRATAF